MLDEALQRSSKVHVRGDGRNLAAEKIAGASAVAGRRAFGRHVGRAKPLALGLPVFGDLVHRAGPGRPHDEVRHHAGGHQRQHDLIAAS